MWAFVGIIFVAFYTATLTATLTVQKFDSRINGPSDLFGKRVATVAHTTSAEYLRELGIKASEMKSTDDAFSRVAGRRRRRSGFRCPGAALLRRS